MSWTVLPEYPTDARGHACSVCHSDLRPVRGGGHERAIDSGIYVDFEGRFVVCESCIQEAGHAIGMVAAGVHAHALHNFREAVLERDTLKVRIADLEAALAALKKVS